MKIIEFNKNIAMKSWSILPPSIFERIVQPVPTSQWEWTCELEEQFPSALCPACRLGTCPRRVEEAAARKPGAHPMRFLRFSFSTLCSAVLYIRNINTRGMRSEAAL